MSFETDRLIILLVGLLTIPALGKDTIVWQVRLSGNRPTNCALAMTRVVHGEKGQPVFEADSRRDQGEWHSCIILPKGLLEAGKDYVVALDYEVIERSGNDAYFYVFGRSDHLGIGADQWQRWHGESGARGVAKLRISPTAGDFIVTAGIHRQGVIRIWNMKVLLGSGWTTLPLNGVAGHGPPPAPPTGAQPFTVDAPDNPSGPVLSLVDFGAVADGDSPPSPGPDRNLTALNAAIAKCRELKASRLIVPKGVYRITSGDTMIFDGLSDFTFDGGGSTFLFHQIKGGAGMLIKNCTRTVFRNYNLDWDWKIDPLASIGRVTKAAADSSFFEMRFETAAPLDPKRWVTMNPLDERLRAPGAGQEFGNFGPKRIEKLNDQTVRVWPSYRVPAKAGHLYLLRHYTYEKHAMVMSGNSQLSLQYVTIFSFPGIGFIAGGDQSDFELLHCRITFPDHERRPITTTADGFHVAQSQGFIRMEDCDFGYMGDDCVNIHDNIHSGVRRVDAHTLVAENIVAWSCPYAPGDAVEIRGYDYSPTGFTGTVKTATSDYKKKEVTLVFEQELPGRVHSDAILFNHRYHSHNCIIRNCYFHENRARGVLCNTADWLIEGNRFFHNQHSAMLLIADVGPNWSEGFGAQNVIVRDNQFEAANSLGALDGAVVALSATSGGNVTHYPLVQNVLFENNEFKDMTGPAIAATSFKNLTIRQNGVIVPEQASPASKMCGAIRAELGNGLWLESNEWITSKGPAFPCLYYDAETTAKIVCQGNRPKN
jgi:parallel beta helix pectate lyase-like protein